MEFPLLSPNPVSQGDGPTSGGTAGTGASSEEEAESNMNCLQQWEAACLLLVLNAGYIGGRVRDGKIFSIV